MILKSWIVNSWVLKISCSIRRKVNFVKTLGRHCMLSIPNTWSEKHWDGLKVWQIPAHLLFLVYMNLLAYVKFSLSSNISCLRLFPLPSVLRFYWRYQFVVIIICTDIAPWTQTSQEKSQVQKWICKYLHEANNYFINLRSYGLNMLLFTLF